MGEPEHGEAMMATADVLSMMGKHPLEGDGLVSGLYFFLHAKDAEGAGLNCHLPDTIVYRHRHLDNWYFSSRGRRTKGAFKRKNRANISNKAIEEHFLKRTSPGFDIVAVKIELAGDDDDDDAAGAGGSGGGGGDEASPATTIEYLDAGQLSDFLHKHRKPMCGILQRFVEPHGAYNGGWLGGKGRGGGGWGYIPASL